MLLDVKEFYKLLVRPTVVISTISPHNIANAAPFSWNAPMATNPTPLFGFSSNVLHDTWRNIQANGDFVVNLVGASFGPLMGTMERDLPYEVSEITACGLSEAPSNHVTAPRIQEAFGWLECTMKDHIVLSDRNVWVIGEVHEAEVKDAAFNDVVNVEEIKPLNHIWGEIFVTQMQRTRFQRAS
jgi:flavin reductase (DIM6/NTAB) family NADH-FMN oxidoreductase RutF